MVDAINNLAIQQQQNALETHNLNEKLDAIQETQVQLAQQFERFYQHQRPELQPQVEYHQQQQPSSESNERVKSYIMLSDSGESLTVRQAWDEFHDPIAQAKRMDPAWPYTLLRKKLYSRRRKFINLTKENAKGD
ncbi:hypothetical protein BGZ51_006094 [Haplosporangium sp. Z 767]|nr:hypothetical protein BGZ51_006094 [Haplosporangium sp. Z 767]KAF9180794.1 hypothetical protein BGZ50_005906 [Haplosporangium sp. Z 11]